ncbi:class II fructose-bisphosphate aldolase [Enterococcus sp. DIV1298c]|uniref:class II fructose-bisphosphate aldolase n=1 Tax=Enterococcus sp. DIV1298c TaxID=2815328 RepID=UPI001A91A61E|nr:class II fructose-bisphosphate aldolase [Enterococcus sp. DIV1298c]MBO0461336.1 class II fructose-bisphosphate aldolase [Enterococcus sp. DIV1298c]
MLVTTKELFEQADKNNYAIPAANFFDLDSARTYVKTAERLKKPLILAFAQSHMDMMSLEEAALIGKFLAEQSTSPVALHLDHGQDEEIIKQAIDLGFTSVMIDVSEDSFEENVRRSKAIADYAHPFGVVVEAEIGHVGAGDSLESEESDSIYTEFSEAVKFAEATGVDSLAVSIGTAHGHYTGTPKINFAVLQQIYDALAIPLVLHGGSSSGDENLEKCALNGIRKINIFTDFITAAMDKIRKEQPENYFDLIHDANDAIAETLEHYFNVFHTASHE